MTKNVELKDLEIKKLDEMVANFKDLFNHYNQEVKSIY